MPDIWSHDLTGNTRLRVITNYLTRMRYLDEVSQALLLQYKTLTKDTHAKPWFEFIDTKEFGCELMFGHWAALKGNVSSKGIYGLDTGCYFDGTLTAMCIQSKEKFQIVHSAAGKL